MYSDVLEWSQGFLGCVGFPSGDSKGHSENFPETGPAHVAGTVGVQGRSVEAWL